jgi:hypothetical protein
MCCFSGPVISVTQTKIFARTLPLRRQGLIYGMALNTPEDVAMILPIPVQPGSGEDAVKFMSFAKYPGVFTDLASLFPQPRVAPSYGGANGGLGGEAEPIRVVQVGAFDASFVPTIKDFSRVDERFRIPDDAWEKLGQYSRFGFAVFKLRKGNAVIHPMAFTFPSAMPERLFFPTVHIHDGKVHTHAEFDHVLYAQTTIGYPPREHRWAESARLAAPAIKIGLAHGLFAADQHVFGLTLKGKLRNVDVIA